MPSPHPYTYDQMREPVYRDDFDEARHRYQPPPDRHRAPRRHDFEPQEKQPHRRRAQRDVRPPPSVSDSESPPPPRRHRSQREPRPRAYEPYDSYGDRHVPARRPPERQRRDDGYISDNRHNRPRRDIYDDRYDNGYEYLPRRDPHRNPHIDRERVPRDRYGDLYEEWERMPRDRQRDDRYRNQPRSRPKSAKPATPRWQKEAKNMFVEYAVPVIKAEGGKFLSKQIGSYLAKK